MSLPKIPDIKFVATKGSEVEEFTSYRDFEVWVIDECNRDIYDAYRDADPDSRRGCDGMDEWVSYTMDANELIEFLEFKGWEVKRVTYDLSNEPLKGC